LVNSTLNESNRSVVTEEGLEASLCELWTYLSKNAGKENFVIPILGTGRGRINMTRYKDRISFEKQKYFFNFTYNFFQLFVSILLLMASISYQNLAYFRQNNLKPLETVEFIKITNP